MVVTSSIRAVFGFGNEKPQGYVYGEDDWNETSTLENNQAYSLSKTLAEVSEPHMLERNQLYRDTEPLWLRIISWSSCNHHLRAAKSLKLGQQSKVEISHRFYE